MGARLSKRLKRIASHVIPGRAAADIGADHGLLAGYLVQSGICPKVIIGELNEGPWLRARAYVAREGLGDFIEVRRGDGLAVLDPGEVATVIIAGLGGRVISDILAASPRKSRTYFRYVLQPQPPVYPLRKTLNRLGWAITEEEIVTEKENVYIIVVTEPNTREGRLLSELELEVGPVILRRIEKPEVRRFLLMELARWENMIQGLQASESIQARAKLTRYCGLKRELEEILHAGNGKADICSP